MAKIEVLEGRHVTRTMRRSETALDTRVNAQGIVTYSPSQPRPIWARYAAEGAGIRLARGHARGPCITKPGFSAACRTPESLQPPAELRNRRPGSKFDVPEWLAANLACLPSSYIVGQGA